MKQYFLCLKYWPVWNIVSAGTRPTDGIAIEFEIWSKFGVHWFKMCSVDHNLMSNSIEISLEGLAPGRNIFGVIFANSMIFGQWGYGSLLNCVWSVYFSTGKSLQYVVLFQC